MCIQIVQRQIAGGAPRLRGGAAAMRQQHDVRHAHQFSRDSWFIKEYVQASGHGIWAIFNSRVPSAFHKALKAWLAGLEFILQIRRNASEPCSGCSLSANAPA